jgi:ABC-2 type transport system ATP-binding protein
VDHGKVIALGSPEDLISRLGGDHLVEVAFDGDGLDAADLRELPGVVAVRAEGDVWALSVTAPHVTIPALLDRLQSGGRRLARLTTRHASLEDVFVTLTGRHLREDEAPAA